MLEDMSVRKMKLLVRHVNPTGKSHTASVIFLHGASDTGRNFLTWVHSLLGRKMEFPHIKLIYPTAPLQPYTPKGGRLANVWFDRYAISIEAPENHQSLSESYKRVMDLINKEVKQGIPLNRIIVGGFSMGGALAMHTAFFVNRQLAGVFACSSFLNRYSVVYDSLSNDLDSNSLLPELRMFHGDGDTIVPIEWGRESFDNLLELGVEGSFTTLKNTLHELEKQELSDLREWIISKLPPLEDIKMNTSDDEAKV